MDFNRRRDHLLKIDITLIQKIKNNPAIYNHTQQSKEDRASLFQKLALELKQSFTEWESISGTHSNISRSQLFI